MRHRTLRGGQRHRSARARFRLGPGHFDRLQGSRLSERLLLLGVGFIVALLSGSPNQLCSPAAGLDSSWMGGLHMANHQGLSFGSDVVFTFGPLGFLYAPCVYFVNQAVGAFLFHTAVYASLGTILVWTLSRGFMQRLVAYVVAAPLAIALVSLQWSIDTALMTSVFILCVLTVIDRIDGVPLRLLALAAGPVVAATSLIKLSSGVAVVAFVGATTLVVPQRRWVLPAFLATFGLSALLFWLLAGSNVLDIPAYLRVSIDVVTGYSSAMVHDDGLSRGALQVALLLVIGGIGAALWSSRSRSTLVRVYLVSIWCLLAFFSFKAGFVRSDPEHRMFYFLPVATCLLGFVPRDRDRLLGAIGLSVLCVVALSAEDTGVGIKALWPRDSIAALREYRRELTLLAEPSEVRDMASAVRARMRAHYGVDPRLLAQVSGKTVHVFPYEANVAWAYDLHWRPLPIFQSYAAYTKQLDDLNARALRSSSGPQMILVELEPAIDGRNLSWESPASIVAMLCNYEEIDRDDRWQLLQRIQSRCGRASELGGHTDAYWGQPIALPQPDIEDPRLIVARVEGVAPHGVELIQRMLYRAEPRAVLAGGRRFALVPDTAANGLLTFVPASLDYRTPFSFGNRGPTARGATANVTSLVFLKGEAGDAQPHEALKVQFYTIDITGSPAGESR